MNLLIWLHFLYPSQHGNTVWFFGATHEAPDEQVHVLHSGVGPGEGVHGLARHGGEQVVEGGGDGTAARLSVLHVGRQPVVTPWGEGGRGQD